MKRLRSLAPAATMVALVLTMILAPAAAARGQVLQHVPGDALLVAKVKNLQQVSTKITALAQQMGVAALHPAMMDPLAALKGQSGVTNGLDAAGDFALYIPNGVAFEGDEPPIVMLWPVSDYKAFVANFADAKTEGEYSTFTMGENPKPTYAAKWGNYAALTMKRELLDKKADRGGFKPSPAAAKELDTKDFALVGNFRVLREQLLPLLQQGREKMIADIDAQFNPAPDAAPDPEDPNAAKADKPDPKFAPIAKAAANQAMTVFESFLRDAENGAYAVQLSDAGINGTVLADFKPDSYLGKMTAKLKGSNDSLVTGLPQGNYLFYGATAVPSDVATQLLKDTLAPVEKELAGLGDEGKAAQKYLDGLKEFVAASKESKFGLVAPSGQLGQDSLVQMITVTTGDANKVIEASRKMAESQEQLTALIPQAGPQPKTTITKNAKTVDGVQLDQFTTQFTPAEGAELTPQEQQAAQMVTMMYGPNGLVGYTGVVDNKAVMVAGGNDELLASTIKAVKANDATLAKAANVTAVAKQLPSSRVAEIYVPLDRIVSTGAAYAAQFGMPVQVQLPENLPPIGIAASSDGSALRFDSHVPTALMQQLVAAGMQAFMAAQQAPQGGPGGL